MGLILAWSECYLLEYALHMQVNKMKFKETDINKYIFF